MAVCQGTISVYNQITRLGVFGSVVVTSADVDLKNKFAMREFRLPAFNNNAA